MDLTIDQALQQGLAAHKKGNLQEAERLYRLVLQLQPAHPVASNNLELLAGSAKPSQQQLNSLMGYFRNGQFADAEASALALTKQFPADQVSWKVLAAIYGQTGRKADALNAMQVVVQLSPQDSGARMNLSYMLRDAGRLEEAAASCKQALALNPESPEAHNDLGMMQQQLGRMDEAVVSYRRAIALNSTFIDAHSNLAGVLRQLGKLEEAEASCRKVIELEPRDAFGHCDLGTVLQEQGRLEDSEASFRQGIALNPNLARAHNSLGNTLRELGRLSDAQLSYRQAITLEPGLAIAYSNLGIALKDLGRCEEAEENYRQAIALQPGFADAHYNLGTLLFEAKKYKDAAEQFEQIDIPQSKFYGIQCAYHQNEETAFNEQLDRMINQGVVNAVVGLLSNCSEIKYGTKKANPFCGDPLKYIVKTDLNEECDFENIFIKTAKDILADRSISHKDQVHLSNGIQTSGNFFTLEKVSKTKIESIIHAQIEKYRLRFKDSEEGFIKNWPASYTIGGWLVSMQSGGSLTAHIHDTGWITGSVYINIPPKSEPDSGNLVLRVSDQEPPPGAEGDQERSIDLKTGTLCFFPSSLLHHTVPFEIEDQEENRIVLAFDVMPVE